MKKGFTCFALTALFSGLISTANAAITFPLNKIMKNFDHGSQTLMKTESSKYTDFTGTWHGVCSDNDGDAPEQETVTIKNDKEHFEMDGMGFTINDLKTFSDISKSNAQFAHFKLSWSEQGALIMRVVGLSNNFSSSKNSPFPISYSAFSSKLSFTLNNEKLVIIGESTGFSDLPSDGKMNSWSCTLEKVK